MCRARKQHGNERRLLGGADHSLHVYRDMVVGRGAFLLE